MSDAHLIISCSLRPQSHGRLMARELARHLEELGESTVEIDLRDLDLPFCDDGDCYQHADVVAAREAIAAAATVTVATPIYNYEVGGATRNLIALTGRAWSDKTVGFLCAAGGAASYMSVMSFANSLMLDFRCLVVPRFVYASGAAFENGAIRELGVRDRVGELATELVRLSTALRAA